MEDEHENSDNPYMPAASFFGLRISAIVEIVCFFLILFVISLFFDTGVNYFNVCPHPFWLLVIFMASQYGTAEALLAAAISSLILILGPTPEKDVFQEHFEYIFQLAKTPILWFIAAVILGELRMRHIRERDRLKAIVLKAEVDKAKMADSYASLKIIKEKLEIHVATDAKTALAVISSFKELEDLSEEKLEKGILDLVKTLINPEKFSIYFVKDHALKFVSDCGWESESHYKRTFDSTTPLFQAIVDSKQHVFVHSHSKILEYEGVAAVPIIDVKKKIVYGMIKIEQISFTHFKSVNLKELQEIGELVGKAYSNYVDRFGENEK